MSQPANMTVEGDVGLEAVVWLSGSNDGKTAQALARALPNAEWHVTVADFAHFRLSGGFAEVEPRIGGRRAGWIMGRIAMNASPDSPLERRATEVPRSPLHLPSCWFAVDDDGRVACFDRDALGAAPMKRCRGPRAAPVQAVRDAPLSIDLVGVSPDGAGLVRQLVGRHARGNHPAPAFMFVAATDALATRLAIDPPAAATRSWQLWVADAHVVIAGGLGAVGSPVEPGFIDWIHARGLCLGCSRASVLDPRLNGVFVYEHRGIARVGPYDRTADPNEPWSIEAAATALGLSPTQLERSRLPVRFAEKPRLQPVEYVPCTWSEEMPWESESGERRGGDIRGR